MYSPGVTAKIQFETISFNQRLKIGEKIWDNYETYETCEIYETSMGHMRQTSMNSP
jgi:hypothetical protein